MREHAVVRRIIAANAALRGQPGAEVLVPPGDDMALVSLGGARVLVAADQVIEGRHWRAGTPMALVARKAVARNASDVAAMAGVPACCVATVALPPDLPDAEVTALCDGLLAAGREFGCPVVGGDTGMHEAPGSPLVLSVSVLARPGPSGRVVERRGARAGDALCVTGRLGAAAGFGTDGHHLRFTPRIAEAARRRVPFALPGGPAGAGSGERECLERLARRVVLGLGMESASSLPGRNRAQDWSCA